MSKSNSRDITIRFLGDAKSIEQHSRKASSAAAGVGAAAGAAGAKTKKGMDAGAAGAAGLGARLAMVAAPAAIATAAIAGIALVLVAVGAGVVSAVRAFAPFEASLNRVQALTGETGAGMRRMERAAIEAGMSTKYSATQAAQGMEELARGGMKAEVIVGGGLVAALDLAAVSGMELSQAADLTTNMLNVFRLEAHEAERVTTSLAVTASGTSSTVASLGEGMTYVSTSAADMGMSIEETTAGLGLLHDANISGSMSGTALNSALTALKAPTDGQSKALKDLKVSAYDSSGEFVGMESVIRQLQNGVKDLTSEQRNQLMQQAFGVEGSRAMLPLLEAGAEKYGDVARAAEDKARKDELVAANLAGVQGALDMLTGSFDTFKVLIGSLIAAPFEGLFSGLTNILNVMNKVAMGFSDGEYAAENFGKSFNDLRSAVMGIGSALSENFSPFIARLREDFMPAIQKLREEFVNNLLPKMTQALNDLKPTIESAFGTLGEFWDQHGDAIVQGVGLLAQGLIFLAGTAFQDLISRVQNAIVHVQGFIAILGLIVSVGKFVVGIVMDVGSALMNMMRVIGNATLSVMNFAGSVVSWMMNIPKVVANTAASIVTGMRSAWSNATSSARESINGIVTRVQEFRSNAVAQFRSFGSGAVQSVHNLRNGATNAVNQLRGNINSAISGAMSAFTSRVSSGVGEAVNKFRGIPGQVSSALSGMRQMGVNAIRQFVDGLKSQAGSVRNAITSVIPGPISNLVRQNSPAKEGPLSQGGGTEGWGKRAAELYAEGFLSRLPQIANAASLGAEMMLSPGVPASGALLQAVPVQSSTRGDTNITVNAHTNANAQEISREIAWTMRTSGA